MLDGSAAIVAGAGRGIGAAVAATLACHGASVAVVDVDGERADAVCTSITREGGRAVPLVADLRDADAVQRAFDQSERQLGAPGVLVNVAGGMAGLGATMQPLGDWSTEEWERILGLNLGYVFLTCRAALHSMTESGGGSIINIASLSGLNSAPRHAPYGAAKAAMISLTRSLAVEYGHRGIRVNAVAPGTIDTPAAAGSDASTTFERGAALIPLGRRGQPDDVAHAVLFLASDLASYVTGQVLTVDGGASLRFPLPLPDAHLSECPPPAA
jgi:3-oxoacyl-[acyl-carrier protein] reductase